VRDNDGANCLHVKARLSAMCTDAIDSDRAFFNGRS
jgi:hypothetical protein